MFENDVVRKIFGTKRDKITGEWRKSHNAELGRTCSAYERIQQCIQSFSGKTRGKKDLQGGRDIDGGIILKWI